MAVASSSGSNISRHLGMVKSYFKKPMTLVIGILALVSLLSSIAFSSAIDKMANNAVTAMATEGTNIQITSSSSPLSYLLSAIVAACIFLIFFTSMSPSGKPTIFFTILHALSVLQFIVAILASLFVFVFEIVLIFATPTLVNYLAGSGVGTFGTMTPEELETINRQVASFRVTLLIGLVISMAVLGLFLYYYNSQTAFLNSVNLTCKNPQLKSKGAVPYGNISIFIGVFQLIGVVIFYLMVSGIETDSLADLNIDASKFDLTAISTPYMIYAIANSLYIVFRGYFAKGWEKFTEDNKDLVYESTGSGTRYSDASPMPTFKSTTRHAQEARQQSQPYLIGEEEDKNKKSSYIPEELQNDYPQQPVGSPYGQQNMDPFGGGYGQQQPMGNPYGQQPYNDPFAAPVDPYAQPPIGNPYDGGNPYNNGGYNNGMM